MQVQGVCNVEDSCDSMLREFSWEDTKLTKETNLRCVILRTMVGNNIQSFRVMIVVQVQGACNVEDSGDGSQGNTEIEEQIHNKKTIQIFTICVQLTI
jgi:hypothetical protein